MSSDIQRLENAIRELDKLASAGDAEAENEIRVVGAELRRLQSAPKNPFSGAGSFALQGFNEVATSPFRIAEMGVVGGLKAAGALPEDARGEYISDALGLAREPQTTGQRMALSAGRESVNSLAAATPLGMAARGAAAAAPNLAPTVADRVRGSVTGLFSRAPASTTGAEVAGGLGAGAGAQAGREIAPDSPMAEFAGGLAGGVAASTAPAVAARTPVAAGIRGFRRMFNTHAGEAKARSNVGQSLANSLDETGLVNATRANQVFDELGTTVRPSVAEATNSPSLLATQRAIETSASGNALDALTWRKAQGAREIINNRHRPEFTGREPDVLFDAATMRQSSAQARVDTATASVQERQAALAAGLPAADRPSVGQGIREARAVARRETREQFTQRATDEGINDPSTMFEFDSFRAQVREDFFSPASRFAAQERPQIVRELADMGQTETPAAPVTFEDLQAIRTRIGDELAEAATAGRNNDVRMLTRMKQGFDNFFENVDPANGDPELVGRWREFRGDYKRDFIDRYDRGAAYEIGRRNKRGDYRVHDEVVASHFLRDETSAREYRQLFQNSPESVVPIRDAILDEARTAAVRDGKVDRNALSNYIRRRERVLQEFPEVLQELQGVESSARALASRESSLTSRNRVIARSELGKALNAPVDEIVPRALRNPRLMLEVTNTARRTGNQEALTAAIWDQALRHVDEANPLPDPRQLERFIADNERTLRMALSPDHLRNIRNVYQGLEIMGRTPMPQGQTMNVGALDQLEAFTGTGIPQISSRAFAAASGRVSFRYNVIDGLARFANRVSKRQFDKLMTQALFDPELARDLASMQAGRAVSPAQMRRMNAWLFNLGIPNVEEQDGN